jgi:tRNA(His) guanylyltransferase
MGNSKDPIMSRMKSNYEERQRHYLTRRIPVILRLDGKCMSGYTRPLKNRFDPNFIKVMNLTAIKLCEEIPGAQLAFLQSDEITILLHDYKKLNSEAWFDYCQNKVESVSAAITAVEFTLNSWMIWQKDTNSLDKFSCIKPATFDSRSHNIPEAEVCNNFLARQLDATKNSINSLAQSLYSHKELQGKSSNEMQELCFQKRHNWNDLPISWRRGRCVVKTTYEVGDTTRTKWVVDDEIPEFSKDRNYIEKYLATEE